jgi:ribosomal protein L25 (general stress protein Ctc)
MLLSKAHNAQQASAQATALQHSYAQRYAAQHSTQAAKIMQLTVDKRTACAIVKHKQFTATQQRCTKTEH